MGWQVLSSGGKYASPTGHALLIGAISKKIMDSLVLNKKCGVCTKQISSTGSSTGVRKHNCVKNYEGSSKAMETKALTTMLIRMPAEKDVSICTIISDDDSNGRAKS
jgi:tRNA(Ile2) C34 agmatinyltransferase TiaS